MKSSNPFDGLLQFSSEVYEIVAYSAIRQNVCAQYGHNNNYYPGKKLALRSVYASATLQNKNIQFLVHVEATLVYKHVFYMICKLMCKADYVFNRFK